MKQRIKITRVDLCENSGFRVGSVEPVDMYVKRDLAGNMTFEIHQPCIVVHELPKGAGQRLYFYVNKTAVLWIASPMVTSQGSPSKCRRPW